MKGLLVSDICKYSYTNGFFSCRLKTLIFYQLMFVESIWRYFLHICCLTWIRKPAYEPLQLISVQRTEKILKENADMQSQLGNCFKGSCYNTTIIVFWVVICIYVLSKITRTHVIYCLFYSQEVCGILEINNLQGMEDKVNSLKLPAQSYPAMEKVCLSGGDKNVYMWGHYFRHWWETSLEIKSFKNGGLWNLNSFNRST